MTGTRAAPSGAGLTAAQRRALLERLAAVHAGRHGWAVVESELLRAERELDGQVPAGAREELMHRLVDCRLRTRRSER